MFKKSVVAEFVMVYGRELIDAVSESGWNLYDSTNLPDTGTRQNGDDVIRNGPAEELQAGRRYVLMPLAEKPRSPIRVFAELERVALALGRKMPTISTPTGRFSLTGFRIINLNLVNINTPDADQHFHYR